METNIKNPQEISARLYSAYAEILKDNILKEIKTKDQLEAVIRMLSEEE